MKITKRQLRRIIKEEIDRMTGLPEGTPTMTVEVEWYPPPYNEETEGTMYIIPLSVGKQGHDAVRDYIDGKFYPRHNYIFSKGGADEIDRAAVGALDR
jgi:hypothetical protein